MESKSNLPQGFDTVFGCAVSYKERKRKLEITAPTTSIDLVGHRGFEYGYPRRAE